MKIPAFALAAALLLPVVPASAGACRPLVSDPANDIEVLTGAPVDDSRKVDLVVANVSSDRKSLTVRMRVVRLDPESEPVLSHGYELSFTSNGKRWNVVGAVGPTGSFFAAGYGGVATDQGAVSAESFQGLGPIEGRVDNKANEIVMTAPLSIFAPQGGLKGEISDPFATTATGVATITPVYRDFAYMRVDDARGTGRYVLGRPACR